MNYLGVDLGGTNIIVGLVNEDGKIVESISTPTIPTRKIEVIFDDIINLCKELIKKHNLNKDNLKGIGFGVPGEVDVKNGIINYSNNIPINNFDAQSYVKNKLDFPVKFANDADCAGLGELIAGTGKGCSDIIVLTLGTGVGGGIVINKKVFTGFYAGGAELGHQVIVHNGEKCTCGNNGCLEAYASATALIRDGKAKALQNSNTALHKEVLNGDLENLNAKNIFDCAEKGDQLSKQLVEDYLDYLSSGIVSLINIFKPEMILLSGGISKQGKKITEPLTEKVSKRLFGSKIKTKIDIASLGSDAGLIGASMLVK